MNTSGYGAQHMPARRPGWRDAATASLLALGNFGAVALGLRHLVSQFQHDHNDVGRNPSFFLGSDLATPLIGWMWLLILINGVMLTVRRQTRPTGSGILVAAGVIAIPVVVWLCWTLVTYGSG